MAFQILPQEFRILADEYVIRTRVPKDAITDDMLLLRVRNANLSAGDRVVVQCMSHTYDRLLHEAEFRVVERTDGISVKEINDRETRQINETGFVIARKGEWWAAPGVASVAEPQGGPVKVAADGADKTSAKKADKTPKAA